ncbi:MULTISPECIES: IlvD/Edd family dehydratase [unclassified Chelatococcus]|uniref:IlvD/Edd family dehydratase n=1 Tax=unclassified Chelatococcus TaxID=2638111 RepID=UPI0002D7CE7D|nr:MULTISPECIES: IlvD/Edd family dehydratase [unclassified Chelatococcus]ALA20085.1 dihydroxy-acid dehydratase [Chelatococcus sp. CO-6]
MKDDEKPGEKDALETGLRSRQWFGRQDSYGFIYRSWMKNQGFPARMFDGRPVIGICNTWSELTPCNAHLRMLAEHVKRGVYEAGGFPVEFPVMSLGESNMRPTTMLFRNLASMDVEASIRANPIDGVVLLVGCDKTTPASLMGAASVDLPTIVVSGGPMLSGHWKGRRIGSGTDVIRFKEAVRAGEMSVEEFMAAEAAMSRSAGSCMTMGTASTLASLCEALGVALPGNGAIPAVDARRQVLAFDAGSRAVAMVHEHQRLSKVLTREAFENAVVLNAALGGSTNAVVHLIALAGRLGVPFTLDDWDRIGADVPCLVNLMPSGAFLMEDFHRAGGVSAVLRELRPRLNAGAPTVAGCTLGESVAGAEIEDPEVIHSLARPFKENGGIAVLRGNLAPGGAVIKPSAASPQLMSHRGRAVVFDSADDLKKRIDDPDLPVDADSVLVLRNCGPKGYPGMAEIGNLPIPARLLRQGITDMVRISDARMSGTAFGTVVLHVAPEAAAGGPLALVADGDIIELDVAGRCLHLDVAEEELARRRAALRPFVSPYSRGYEKLYVEHVLQADQGVDFDFLVGGSGDYVPRESH